MPAVLDPANHQTYCERVTGNARDAYVHLPDPLAAFARRFFADIMNGDVDAVGEAYSDRPETTVFVEGPRWVTKGAAEVRAGWRAFGSSGFRMIDIDWEQPLVGWAGLNGGWMAGIATLHAQVGQQPAVAVRMRTTHVMIREPDERWRIIHEHASQPHPDPYGAGDWVS